MYNKLSLNTIDTQTPHAVGKTVMIVFQLWRFVTTTGLLKKRRP